MFRSPASRAAFASPPILPYAGSSTGDARMSDIALDPGERIAKSNGLELCYQTFGVSTDPAMLMIMGLGAQMIVWDDEFCEALAARRFFVIRFDNRDVGKSSKINIPPIDVAKALFALKPGERLAAPYLLSDMAADALGLLDALGIAKAHLVGASMGGMIAQEIAIRHPKRVLSLTSMMSTTGDPSLPPPTPEAMGVFLAPPPRTVDEYVQANVNAWRLFGGPAQFVESQRDFARAVRAAARGLCPEGGARQFTAVIASGSRKAALASIRVPTLVIHGAIDPLVPLAAGEDTARSIPNAKLVVIDGMGHTMPRAVWGRVIDEIAAIAR
jgi:pimeloyl-ACP methyl ester carboxylesterase